MALDCHWSFEEQLKELKAKAKRRLVIISKVANTIWGLESRILAITTHSLVESVANYGLASFGGHLPERDIAPIGTTIINRAARKVIGTGPTIRREILYALADMRSINNHFILKVANILDRTLRATGTAAEKKAKQVCIKQYCPESQNYPGVNFLRWETQVITRENREIYAGSHTKQEDKDRIPKIAWSIAQ